MKFIFPMLIQIPYERRTFYQTLLNLLFIPSTSCLFFNASNPIEINQTFNSNDENVKFLVHIIAYDNSFRFVREVVLSIFSLVSVIQKHSSYWKLHHHIHQPISLVVGYFSVLSFSFFSFSSSLFISTLGTKTSNVID